VFKNRSKFGKWLDNKGISQVWVAQKAGVSCSTVSLLANDTENHKPNFTTLYKILDVLNEIDPNIKVDDFWDM
jgi:transcriptional regulator with XRE-family HTH domain